MDSQKRIEAQAAALMFEAKLREERGRQFLRSPAPPAPPDSLPPKIKAALAGKRKLLPLCELLWGSLEQFVEWDTIGAKVWLSTKEDIATMQTSVRRLNEDLCRIKGCDYRAESFQQSGARIYTQTKDGQT
jgi:hypothetical protein